MADDLYDQNFVEIKGTTIEGAHSIYIETWKSINVADVESTLPKSGLFYDLWDTQQDLVNFVNGQLDIPTLTWSIISNTGLGISGPNNQPDNFLYWRNNLTAINLNQSFSVSELFRFYGIQ